MAIDNKKKNQELTPYKIDKLARIPSFWKIILLKWWASGATYFFTFAVAGIAFLDQLVLLWLILAMIIEYVINKIILWMSNDRDKTEKFLAYEFPRKKLINIFVALLYSFVMVSMIFLLVEYVFQGYTIDRLFFLGYEGNGPMMFATLFVLLDLGWIKLRGLLKIIIGGKKNEV